VAIKLYNITPSLQKAAEVSSQDDSMANIVGNVWCLVAPSIPQRGKLEAVVILMFVVVLLFFVQKVPDLPYGRQGFNLFKMLNFIQKQTY
jgi:hypothetical protein